MIRRALEVPGLLALGATATLVAALVVAIIATVLTFPFSILAILIFPIFLFGLVLAAILAAPVTLAVLPLTYRLMRSHPILAQLAVPLVGLAAGGAAACFWIAIGVLPQQPNAYQVFSAIGMISGLSGGAFFVRGLYA
ncbi:hypothetical protein JQ604_19900 [Bradyrhizobium jicamae]|uniref:hypothetical protein n=1 Tax=Bradyrhizobium jicamae TaxID=280332 RepID=UPI001BA55C2D|nr:hypothetical protein [Bradyrhizobium jicamae]MBR0754453.1 hypothetical protein [Bradyrhizobium jicamae]